MEALLRNTPGGRRSLPILGTAAAFVALALWMVFFADATPAGTITANPGNFVVTMLDAVTFAGLLFVAASGFTLIFGLMRTVNMAHGSLFLLAAYVAIRVQQAMVGRTRNIDASQVGLADWLVPMLVGATVAAVLGLLMQQ